MVNASPLRSGCLLLLAESDVGSHHVVNQLMGGLSRFGICPKLVKALLRYFHVPLAISDATSVNSESDASFLNSPLNLDAT